MRELTKLSRYLISVVLIRETSSNKSGDFERYAIILLPAIGNKSVANLSVSFTAAAT